ncbi:hypothetical protein [Formosa maritima]|uniref:Cytochrome c domain-containing protein n=1 Tax=Formosa maritima TaxID=2592046 RepID=A0A5D0GEV7_9FLAO|nr:hypothetical protein [Formosa maritima]TYA57311.1 hypothetical protein FVF61_05245 [Formosa maritima]
MKHIHYILMLVLINYHCTSVSEEDLIDNSPIEDEFITYNQHVKTIIDNNCISCHTMPPENGAPMPLLSYDHVTDAMLNRDLFGRISSEDLGFLMPFGGPRLPQNLIDIIMQWDMDGLLEE